MKLMLTITSMSVSYPTKGWLQPTGVITCSKLNLCSNCKTGHVIHFPAYGIFQLIRGGGVSCFPVMELCLEDYLSYSRCTVQCVCCTYLICSKMDLLTIPSISNDFPEEPH